MHLRSSVRSSPRDDSPEAVSAFTSRLLAARVLHVALELLELFPEAGGKLYSIVPLRKFLRSLRHLHFPEHELEPLQVVLDKLVQQSGEK
jgi:hypothetical protein